MTLRLPSPGLMPVLRSELTKIGTLRSCTASLAALFVTCTALGAVSGWSVRRAVDRGSSVVRPDFDPEAAGLAAVAYGQFALIVFGVLIIGHEYSSGMIRLSLTAVPRRGVFYTAKLLAGAGAALAVALPSVFLGYLATQAGLGAHGTTLSAPELPRAMAGAVTYLVLTTVLCAGIAGAVRSPVAALAVLTPLYFLVSQLLMTVEATAWFARYLPDQAGFRMFAVGADLPVDPGEAASLSPVLGLAVLVAWTCAAVAAGMLRLRRLEL
ncbi:MULTISPECIES: ABC transporter permease [Streptomyces]|uniref:ABC transporter permease n=1 Tax=Streptomyces lycii TaxID=2654337 RepID=A0ABQ7FKN5_9ACTN|nr:ABC transporter permease [Streptomyces lycii]KAF4409240.1 ABC transporter permease [Streptomyces lycii]PGH49463.1 ABC transporter permease [Streptomyces sp. Ru87]